METPASFNLNRAVQQWRAQLAQSPAIRGENLEELEAHLRDSVAGLQSRGLAAEEAFVVATHRLGQPARLGAEYGKINRATLWVDRLFCAVVFMQAWWIASNFSSGCSRTIYNLAQIQRTNHGGHTFIQDTLTPVIFGLLYLIPVIGLVFVIRFLLKYPDHRWSRGMTQLSQKPLRLSLMLFSLSTCLQFAFLVAFYATLPLPQTQLTWPLVLVNWLAAGPRDVALAVATYFLARKRLLRVA